jgi:hypothetical protein
MEDKITTMRRDTIKKKKKTDFLFLPKAQKKSMGEKQNKRKDVVKRRKVQVPTTT